MADVTQNVTLTVNGRTITAPKGTLLIEACKQNGIEIPAFCYYPGLSLQGACRMCLVEIEKMPKMQTACTTPVAEGMVVQTESEKVVQARKSTLELAARKPSARLPCLRRRRRVRIAGHDLQVRRGRVEVHRHQEPSRRAAVVADRLLRPPALHSLLPLRARLRRRHGRLGAGHSKPRPGLGDRAQPGRLARLRRVRHVHRYLSGRRTHQRLVPLQDASLGDDPRRHRLHPLRRRLPYYGGRAPLR